MDAATIQAAQFRDATEKEGKNTIAVSKIEKAD